MPCVDTATWGLVLVMPVYSLKRIDGLFVCFFCFSLQFSGSHGRIAVTLLVEVATRLGRQSHTEQIPSLCVFRQNWASGSPLVEWAKPVVVAIGRACFPLPPHASISDFRQRTRHRLRSSGNGKFEIPARLSRTFRRIVLSDKPK